MPSEGQKQVAAAYLTDHAALLPPPSSYDPHGRATPDLSLLGANFAVVLNGQEPTLESGTSASAPQLV